ncbi:hypothetical protein CMO83_03215 [Candidatus Woesearchaeota archaeon]|jgi:hypothetical protein|nr:hypothetical protein [Candidatus Woesearchaeota archaeon]|tara:strand:- start:16119 stop:17159 length:1041 start_codon:yes stop_codon:yes gene_type:complete
MGIDKIFTTSFSQLKKNKVLVAPVLISLILLPLLVLIYLNISGLYGVSTDLIKISSQYDEDQFKNFRDNVTQGGSFTASLLEYLDEGNQSDDKFDKYSEEQGFELEQFIPFINRKNIVLLIIFVIISIVLSFYLSIASYAIVTLNIKNQKLNLSNTVKLTNRFILKFLALKIILFLLIMIPLILGIGILILLYILNIWLGVLITILFVFGYLAYLIYILIKFYFAVPIMFIEEQSVLKSFRYSYQITKNNLLHVLLLFGVMFGLGWAVSGLVSTPKFNILSLLFTSNNAFLFLIILVIGFLLLILESFVLTFINVFYLYSYIDFKDGIKKKQYIVDNSIRKARSKQ